MVMRRFEFLPHTADVKFRAYGKTLEEAFANAVLAMFQVMTDIQKVKLKKIKKIKVSATQKESLLYDFLEALLFFVDTEGFLVGKVKKLDILKKNNKYVITATVQGDVADAYDVRTQIKAVTYNDMFIKEEERRVTIQVVVDI